MTIKFKSIYGIDKNTIEFTSKLEKTIKENITILEFLEPSNNVANRIEYSNNAISIFAGPTTIDLELNKNIKNNFVTEHGKINIISHLKRLKIEENRIEFDYILSDENGNLINNFELDLQINLDKHEEELLIEENLKKMFK